MRKTQIIGRIGNDAEVKKFNDNSVINFSVAVSEKFKDGEKTTWYECAKWGNNTKVAEYLTKGTQVYVEGVSEARAYIGNDGEAKAVNGLNAFRVQLLGGLNQKDVKEIEVKEPETLEPQKDDLPF